MTRTSHGSHRAERYDDVDVGAETLESDLELTRAELAGTLTELARRADVPARMARQRRRVRAAADRVRHVTETTTALTRSPVARGVSAAVLAALAAWWITRRSTRTTET